MEKIQRDEEFDVLNFQAIELLARLGNDFPSEEQISMVEYLLAAAEFSDQLVIRFTRAYEKVIH